MCTAMIVPSCEGAIVLYTIHIYNHMAWASAVACSSIKGIAKTSRGGTSNGTPRLFLFKHDAETLGVGSRQKC